MSRVRYVRRNVRTIERTSRTTIISYISVLLTTESIFSIRKRPGKQFKAINILRISFIFMNVYRMSIVSVSLYVRKG